MLDLKIWYMNLEIQIYNSDILQVCLNVIFSNLIAYSSHETVNIL